MFKRSLILLPSTVIQSQRHFSRKINFDKVNKYQKTSEDVVNSKWFHRVIKIVPAAVKYIPSIIMHGPKFILTSFTCFGIGYLCYLANLSTKKFEALKMGFFTKYNDTITALSDSWKTAKENIASNKETVGEVLIRTKDAAYGSLARPISEKYSKMKEKGAEVYSNWLKKKPTVEAESHENNKLSTKYYDKVVSFKNTWKDKLFLKKKEEVSTSNTTETKQQTPSETETQTTEPTKLKKYIGKIGSFKDSIVGKLSKEGEESTSTSKNNSENSESDPKNTNILTDNKLFSLFRKK